MALSGSRRCVVLVRPRVEPVVSSPRQQGMRRLAAPLTLALLLVGCASGDSVPDAAQAGVAPVAPPSVADGRTGPVGEDGRAASCAEGYSSKTIGNRSFAFDGTITKIGPGSTNKPDRGILDTAAVSFAVDEWFKGGLGDSVTVDLMALPSAVADDGTPAYEVGTRLLVSGEPRWGGPPLQDAIAWSCGGFTRYYEPAVADDWRTGTA